MAKEYRVTYMSGNQWKLPLNLAIGFHVIVGLSAIYLPGLLEPKPRFEDIYTVNLVNLSEPAPAPPVEQPEPAPQPAPEPEPIVEKSVSIAPPANEAPPAPPKAISLKPLKKKKVKKVVKKVETNNADKLNRQKLAEMIRAQQEADRQARLLEEEAERERKMLEKTRTTAPRPANKPAGTSTASSGAPSSSHLSSVEKQYYATLKSRLMSLWSLPEYKQWDPSLKASVVITIRKNGEVADFFFENKSGDILYDRFVMKTLKEIGKLPPIPPVLKKQRMEIGLIFTPGKIR